MSEPSTLARPYAEALFKVSKEKKIDYSVLTYNVSLIYQNELVKDQFNSPDTNKEKLTNLFLDALNEKLDDYFVSFLKLLIENSRINLIKEISMQYISLMNLHNGVVEANVISAFELNETQLKNLTSKLKEKFKSNVKIKSSTDKNLIGGLKIIVGDTVIDGSISFHLKNLHNQLLSI